MPAPRVSIVSPGSAPQRLFGALAAFGPRTEVSPAGSAHRPRYSLWGQAQAGLALASTRHRAPPARRLRRRPARGSNENPPTSERSSIESLSSDSVVRDRRCERRRHDAARGPRRTSSTAIRPPKARHWRHGWRRAARPASATGSGTPVGNPSVTPPTTSRRAGSHSNSTRRVSCDKLLRSRWTRRDSDEETHSTLKRSGGRNRSEPHRSPVEELDPDGARSRDHGTHHVIR